MKKSVFFTLIIFGVYCLGVVLYYQKDEITKQVTAVTNSLSSTEIESLKDTNTVSDDKPNLSPEQVVQLQKDIQNNPLVGATVSQKVVPGIVKDSSGNIVAPTVEVSVTTNQQFDLKTIKDAPVIEKSFRSEQLNNLLGNSTIRSAITLALCLFAFIQWIDYMAKFSPSDALPKIITPAMATFLAFKWDMVLAWFRI